MKVLAPIVESVLATIVEGIQPAQMKRAEKVLGEDEYTILYAIGQVDPTVPKDPNSNTFDFDDAWKGKYGSWLVSQWVKEVQTIKQHNWAMKNPEQAREQGISDPDDLLYLGLQHRWIDEVPKMTKSLAAHHRIVSLGKAEEYGVKADINQYATSSELFMDMRDKDAERIFSKADIEKGRADPLKVEGSSVYAKTSKFVVYKISLPEAAKFHGALTKWCFATQPDSARFYVSVGPLYVVYLLAERWSQIPHTVIEAQQPGYFKFLAISPFSDNVETIEKYRKNHDLWEVRGVLNDWFKDVSYLKEIGLMPVLEEIAKEAGDRGAVGFDTWKEKGTYRDEDIMDLTVYGVDNVSPEGAKFLEQYRLPPELIDEEGDIEITRLIDIKHPITIAGVLSELRHDNPLLSAVMGDHYPSRVYVNVRKPDPGDGAWEYIYDIMEKNVSNSAVLDILSGLRDYWKSYVWEEEGRPEFKDQLADYIVDAGEGPNDNAIWVDDGYVDSNAFADAVQNARDADLDALANKIGIVWSGENDEEEPEPEDPPYVDVDQMIVNSNLADIAKFVKFDLGAHAIDEYELYDDEDEDDIYPESRQTMRRILKGTSR